MVRWLDGLDGTGTNDGSLLLMQAVKKHAGCCDMHSAMVLI